MKAKIPSGVLENFFRSNFTIKETPDPNEIRINSVYVDDKSFKTYINLEMGVFNDFKNIGGSIERLIADYLNIPENQVFFTLIKEYSQRGSFEMPEKINEVIQERSKVKLPENLYWFSEVEKGIFRDKAYKYLKDRMIKEEYINEMGYCVDGEFDKRIIIPFWENNHLVYFVARDYSNKSKMRYKNPTGAANRDFVFNYDKIQEGGEVIITEGIMDILSLDEQIGFPILSAHLSATQVTKMFERLPSRIILVPDSDETGELTLQKNIDMIYLYKPASIKIEFGVYHIPKGFKDLNELKQKTGKNFINFSECELRGRKSFSLDKIFPNMV